jgi:hypothetical protein
MPAVGRWDLIRFFEGIMDILNCQENITLMTNERNLMVNTCDDNDSIKLQYSQKNPFYI